MAIFVAQLAVIAYIIWNFKNKAKKIKPNSNAVNKVQVITSPSHSIVSEYYDGEKYFFQKDKRSPPLYKVYGEMKGIGINIFSNETISCDQSEISTLLDVLDPWNGNFFLVISEENGTKTLQFEADTPNKIEIEISDKSLRSDYSGVLVFAGDMKHFMEDYFSGQDVIKRYSLKIV